MKGEAVFNMKEGDRVTTKEGEGVLARKESFMAFDTIGGFHDNLIYDKWFIRFPRFPRLFPNWFNGETKLYKFWNGVGDEERKQGD